MKKWALSIGFPVLLGTLAALSTASASPITVTNFSFETLPVGGLPLGSCGAGCSYSEGAIPGWVTTGDETGQFQPGVQAGNFAFFNSVPDGITIGWTNGGSISQTVTPVVQLGVTYTLMVDVGVRKDVGDPGTEGLLINGTTYFATGVLPSAGNWSTFTATYIGTSADVGKPITIELASNSAEGDWDNVRLSDSTPSAIPEPVSGVLMVLGLALIGIGRVKRAF